jgi:hypothetical protein
MLEIGISLRRNHNDGEIGGDQTDIKKVGDIIVAKKQPCAWGTQEKLLCLITYLKDDELEASMTGDILINPYEKAIPEGEMISHNRCTYRVDTDMFIGSPGLDPHDSTSEPVKPNGKDYLEKTDLEFNDEDRF